MESRMERKREGQRRGKKHREAKRRNGIGKKERD